MRETFTHTSWHSRALAAGSMLFSLLGTWVLLRPPGNLNPFSGDFRGFFSSDQLSYAGVAAAASDGELGTVEPFTQTGNSYYPSLWYKFIGLFARYSGLSLPDAWTLLGYLAIFGSIIFVGFVAWRLSSFPLAPLISGLLLWIGPLSAVINGSWFVQLDSHAVLWGPYAALYPLNAEAVSLSLGSSAIALVFWISKRNEWSPLLRNLLLASSAFTLGLLANFQTYAFLILTAMAVWALAVFGLLSSRSTKLYLVTAIALGLAVFLGPTIQSRVGALPVYAFMCIPALPGIAFMARTRIRSALVAGAAFIVGVAPQLLLVANGTLSRDAFLDYREGSSGDLGIPLEVFFTNGIPILLVWMLAIYLQWKNRDKVRLSLAFGTFIAFVLLSFNDVWGFGQEPYRFWINSVVVFALLSGILLTTDNLRITKPNPIIAIGTIVTIGVVALSAWNVIGFRNYVTDQGNIELSASRNTSIAQLLEIELEPEQLVTVEPCLNPRIVKVQTGAPIAFYNIGMAWPENKMEIDAVIKQNERGILDIDTMRAAGIGYLITDSSCSTAWNLQEAVGVTKMNQVEYLDQGGPEELILWSIGE